MENKEKYKVHCILRANNTQAFFNIDLLFIDGNPAAVINWRDFGESLSVPDTLIPLDPQYLSPMQGWGEVTHLYELPLDCPPAYAQSVCTTIANALPKTGHPQSPKT